MASTTPNAADKAKQVIARPAAVAAVKEKTAIPWNISPYSNGMPGASLTSTSVDPAASTTSQLLWDEVSATSIEVFHFPKFSIHNQEELMFEDFSNPPKGKGKEKDVGKRRAYARIITSLGGGGLNIELYCEKVDCLSAYLFPSLTRFL
jgi:peptidyl-prolyl cis-trans isomerase-like protein 2